MLLGDFGEGLADFDFLGCLIAAAHHFAETFVVLLAVFHCFLGLEFAAAEHVPGCEGDAEVAALFGGREC